MKQLASLLSVWSLCCCLENLAQSLIPKCTSHQMTVKWPNGTFKQCLYCEECHPGRGLYPHKCGGTVTFPVITHCKKCDSGKTFSDTYDTSSCKLCHSCAEHEVVTKNCTLSSDTKCNKTCNSGYFFSDPQQVCKRCSYCCLDGKDEEQPQCINQGLKAFNRYCSPRPDRTCTPLIIKKIISTPTGSVIPTESRSPTMHHKIEWVLSCVGIGTLFGAILLYCLWRRSKKKRRQDSQHLPNLEDGCNLRVTYDPNEGNQGGLMKQEASTLQVQLSENEGFASAASTPQEFRKGIPHSGGFKEQVPPVNVPSKNFPGQPDRTGEKKDESARVALLADNKDGEDDVSDDIDGNGAQVGQIERKGSFGDRLQSLCRKLSNPSNNYEPLSGEDPPDQPIDAVPQRKGSRSNSILSVLRKSSVHAILKEEDTDEPLATIKRSPDSPEVQAGSRVEFRCVVNGCQQVLYRWFKDEQELPGGNNSTLILDPLKMQDFGSYRCEVKSGKRVESTVVELDVTPAEGESYKTLTEVFQSSIYLRHKVANLLRRKVGGLAGYKHVASHYKMDIDVLEQCENPGEGVIAKLGAEHPDLAVYHFCKVLKDKEIRRLDIVKELKGHLI